MLVGSKAKVLESLSGVLWSSKEKGVASSRSSESQLVEGQDFTAGSDDASASSSSEAESSDAELRDGQETVVIGDGADDDNGLVVRLLGDVRSDSRDGHRGSVDTGHKSRRRTTLLKEESVRPRT